MPSSKAPQTNSTDFVFRVEGLKLSAADQQRISAAIGSAVQAELGRAPQRTGTPGIFFPIQWPGGIWILIARGSNIGERVRQIETQVPRVSLEGR